MKLVHTRNSIELTKKISKYTNINFISPVVRTFSSGEMDVAIRNRINHAIVIASCVTHDDWIELFLLLDTLKNTEITIFFTYIGYARQNCSNEFESYGCKMFGSLINTFSIARAWCLDAHSEQFFTCPTYYLSATNIIVDDILKKYTISDIVIIAPDDGGVARAKNVARALNTEIAICSKTRNIFGDVKSTQLYGDVKNKKCIIIDDMIDTAYTVLSVANTAIAANCADVIVYCTHGIFSNNAVNNLISSDISSIVYTDSIASPAKNNEKFVQLSVFKEIANKIFDFIRD